jgi:hypothetical protein
MTFQSIDISNKAGTAVSDLGGATPVRYGQNALFIPIPGKKDNKKGSGTAPFFCAVRYDRAERLFYLFKIGINNIVVVLLAGPGACAGSAAATRGAARITAARLPLGCL